tara:strand:+ start:1014 stop:1418 length:405 start_codon:yes stop_codon:yes gene_type:complete
MQINSNLIEDLKNQETKNENNVFLSDELEELLSYQESDSVFLKSNNPCIYFQSKDILLKTELVSIENKNDSIKLSLISKDSLFNLLDKKLIEKLYIEFNEDNIKEICCKDKIINYKIKLNELNSYLIKLIIKDK